MHINRIADRMTKTKFNQRQEVLALSVANVFAGMFGGIPATAALARTALNVKSGATCRVSGIISSISFITLSLIFLPYFKFLPLPNVAAILVNVAMHMFEIDEIIHIYTNKVSLRLLRHHPCGHSAGRTWGGLTKCGAAATFYDHVDRRSDVRICRANCRHHRRDPPQPRQGGNP